jgi:hypothetical protein
LVADVARAPGNRGHTTFSDNASPAGRRDAGITRACLDRREAHLLADACQHGNERIDGEFADLVIDHVGHARAGDVQDFGCHSLRDACFLDPTRNFIHQLLFEPNRFVDLRIGLRQQPLRLAGRKSQIEEYIAPSPGPVGGFRVNRHFNAFLSRMTAL